MNSKTRYYRWRLRKVISEAQKEAEEFKVMASPKRPPWHLELTYYFDAYIFVLKDGVYIQFAGYGILSPPQKCRDIEEAIDKVAKWMTEHPSRWRIGWEKI